MKNDEIVQIGAARFDPVGLALRDGSGRDISLRRQSAEVLRFFAHRPGEVVSKDEILTAIWPNTHVTDASLVQCIKDIREALGDPDRALLETLPKRGYRLKDFDLRSSGDAATLMRPVLLLRPFSVSGNDDPGTGVLVSRSAANYLSHYTEFAVHPMANPEPDGHYVLEGSILRSGDRLHIWGQLLDGFDGECLWSESFELLESDPINAHDKIGQCIAAIFGDRIANRPPPGDRLSEQSALRYYLAARAATWRYTEADLYQAEALNRRALEVEPTSAFGHMGLGFVYMYNFANGWGDMRRNEALKQAAEHAELGLKLAPFDYGAHYCRGKVHRFEGDLDRAVLRYRRSLELNPVAPNVRHALGHALLLQGKAQESLTYQEETYAMAPTKTTWSYGVMALALWANGRVEEALTMALRKGANMATSDLTSLAVYQVETGHLGDAKRTIGAILDHDPTWRLGSNYLSKSFQDKRTRDRYINALREAGAPE